MNAHQQAESDRAAKRDALSRKAADVPSAESTARTRSLADFLVPGMLDLSIANALIVLRDLSYKAQENQVLVQRLYNRIVFLRREVETTAIGARIQSDVILRYGEQVGKAIQFLRTYASKTLVARIAANRRFLNRIRELHERLDYFFIKAELSTRPEMNEWKTYWDDDLSIRVEWLTSFLSNRFVLLGELTERGVEEALTEIHYELAKEPNDSKHTALMAHIVQKLRFHHQAYLPLPVPVWFVARDEVTYRSEPFAIGSYGALYRAAFERTSVKVVAKSLYSDSKQTQLALFHECSLWAKLDHPNVLKMIGACYVGSPMFFLCEDAGDRRSLHEFVAASPRNKLRMWRLLLDAAEGLAYLHRLGVVHNNLKCSNILVGVDGRAKLSDFSFSYDTTDAKDTSPKRHVTSSRWKAPELLLAITDAESFPTFASDVYALGMCIIEVATGERPWGRTTMDQEVIRKATTERYPRPAVLRDKQWSLIQSMCAFERDARPSVTEVIAALKDIITADEQRAVQATKMCAKCNSSNPTANKFCNECGNRFP